MRQGNRGHRTPDCDRLRRSAIVTLLIGAVQGEAVANSS